MPNGISDYLRLQRRNRKGLLGLRFLLGLFTMILLTLFPLLLQLLPGEANITDRYSSELRITLPSFIDADRLDGDNIRFANSPDLGRSDSFVYERSESSIHFEVRPAHFLQESDLFYGHLPQERGEAVISFGGAIAALPLVSGNTSIEVEVVGRVTAEAPYLFLNEEDYRDLAVIGSFPGLIYNGESRYLFERSAPAFQPNLPREEVRFSIAGAKELLSEFNIDPSSDAEELEKQLRAAVKTIVQPDGTMLLDDPQLVVKSSEVPVAFSATLLSSFSSDSLENAIYARSKNHYFELGRQLRELGFSEVKTNYDFPSSSVANAVLLSGGTLLLLVAIFLISCYLRKGAAAEHRYLCARGYSRRTIIKGETLLLGVLFALFVILSGGILLTLRLTLFDLGRAFFIHAEHFCFVFVSLASFSLFDFLVLRRAEAACD